MSFEEFKRRGIAKRSEGSPPEGEIANMGNRSRGRGAASRGTKFRGVR